MSRKIGKGLGKPEKVELNDYGDFIMIDPSDSSFFERYSSLVKWLDDKGSELNNLGQELSDKYTGDMLAEDEDGNVTVTDPEQFALANKIRADFYREASAQIEKVFGEGALKKYYRDSFEINPEYVPDENAISIFIEEIGIEMKDIYEKRNKALSTRYGLNRDGAK